MCKSYEQCILFQAHLDIQDISNFIFKVQLMLVNYRFAGVELVVTDGKKMKPKT